MSGRIALAFALLVLASGAMAVFFDGFEGGSLGNWDVGSTGTGNDAHPYHGTYNAKEGASNNHQYLYMTLGYLPSTLTFWTRGSNALYANSTLTVRVDVGAGYVTVATLTGNNVGTTSYTLSSFNVSGVTNESAKWKLDFFNPTGTARWYIDDVRWSGKTVVVYDDESVPGNWWQGDDAQPPDYLDGDYGISKSENMSYAIWMHNSNDTADWMEEDFGIPTEVTSNTSVSIKFPTCGNATGGEGLYFKVPGNHPSETPFCLQIFCSNSNGGTNMLQIIDVSGSEKNLTAWTTNKWYNLTFEYVNYTNYDWYNVYSNNALLGVYQCNSEIPSGSSSDGGTAIGFHTNVTDTMMNITFGPICVDDNGYTCDQTTFFGAASEENTAPTCTVVITPSSPSTTDDLTITVTASDIDADTLTASLSMYNGTTNQTSLYRYNSSMTNGSAYGILVVEDGNTTKGEYWSANVSISDGAVTGTCSAAKTIGNTASSLLAPIYIKDSLGTPSVNPTEAGNTTINVTFYAEDIDGVADMTAAASVEGGTTNTTCLTSNINTTAMMIGCDVELQYNDIGGLKNITVNVTDSGGTIANSSRQLTYTTIYALGINVSDISYGTLIAGSDNNPSNFNIINTGNGDAAIYVTGQNMTDGVNIWEVGNFTIDDDAIAEEGEETEREEVALTGAMQNYSPTGFLLVNADWNLWLFLDASHGLPYGSYHTTSDFALVASSHE
jgi:hypothetical protein